MQFSALFKNPKISKIFLYPDKATSMLIQNKSVVPLEIAPRVLTVEIKVQIKTSLKLVYFVHKFTLWEIKQLNKYF